MISEDASISQGEIWIAINIKLSEGWHIYWKNPGVVGLPPQIEWTLPQGMHAGKINFPSPQIFDFEGIISYGHGGEVSLLIPLTVDTTVIKNDSITITAKLDILVCEKLCIPETIELSLTLPVSENKVRDKSEEIFFRQARDTLPKFDNNLKTTLTHTNANNALLDFSFSDNKEIVSSAYFFSDREGVIDAEKKQTFSQRDNIYSLLVPLKESETSPDNVSGVLQVTTSSGKQFFMVSTHLSDIAVLDPYLVQIPPFFYDTAFLLTLVFGFIGGLILNLMPCVFPVIGLKILGFVEQSGKEKSKIISHGLFFTGGVLISFWILAGMLILLREGGMQLGWGFQLQEPRFVYILIIIILIFALNLSGVFEIGTSVMNVGSQLGRKSGFAGSFFSGFLATLIATPCSAPFLAPALGKVLTLPAIPSLILFTAIALGLSFPYLLLSCFPSLVNKLPRPGPWMESFKQGMAFLLYATVIFLAWTFIAQISDESLLLFLLLGLVTISLSVWIYGRWSNLARPKKTRITAALIALVISASTVASSICAISNSIKSDITSSESTESLHWENWSEERVMDALAKDQKVYIDFTARWCATCQWNKRVYKDEKVIAAFKKENILLLKADWTNKDPAITAELARHERFAVPLNVLFIPGNDPVILPELLTVENVLEAINGSN